MIIRDSKLDIFNISKGVTLNGKAYNVSFGTEIQDERTIKVNGEYTDTKVKESDIQLITESFKNQVKIAILEYENALVNQKNYINWDGKLD